LFFSRAERKEIPQDPANTFEVFLRWWNKKNPPSNLFGVPGLCENKALLSFESRRNTARGVAETLAGVNDPEIISEIISYLTGYGGGQRGDLSLDLRFATSHFSTSLV